MRFICVLSLLTVMYQSVYAQPLWTCDGSLIITVGGDFYINRVPAGEIGVNLERLPLPNFGLINGIGYRRSNNCIYGIDFNDPDLRRVFKLTPEGEYEIIQTIEVNGGLSGTMSFDDNHLIIPYQTDSTENLLYIDITEDGTPENYTLSINREDDFSRLGGTDVALDVFSNELYGYNPWTQEFTSCSAETIFLTGRRGLLVQLDSSYRAGIAFLENQVLAGTAGNQFIGFHHLNSGTVIDEIDNNLNFINEGFVDACSCVDFDIALQQSFDKDTLRHCKEAISTIKVINRSATPLPGVDFVLTDSFPPGIFIKEVLHNPYQGMVEGIGTNVLEINAFNPFFGIDSIVLQLEITENAELGEYEVQAILDGFTDLDKYPYGQLLSDDPNVFEIGDIPTHFWVAESDSLSTINTQYYLCEGETLLLNPIQNQLGYALIWEDGSTEVPRLINQAGTYEAMISDACIERNFSLVVEDLYLAVDLGPDQTSLFGKEVEVAADIESDLPIINYSWYLNDSLVLSCPGNCDVITISPEEASNLLLLAEDENGCIANDDLNIRLEYPLFLPNAFSPNNDGINDVFNPQSSGDLPFQNFRIFDRWGSLVFERNQGYTNDASAGWTGEFNDLNTHQGNYVWEITILLGADSETIHLSGGLTLLR